MDLFILWRCSATPVIDFTWSKPFHREYGPPFFAVFPLRQQPITHRRRFLQDSKIVLSARLTQSGSLPTISSGKHPRGHYVVPEMDSGIGGTSS